MSGPAAPVSPPRLQAQDLSSDLLQGVCLSLAAGQVLCLDGPSGGGKSRLLRALADLDPCTGRVLLDGAPRESVPGPRWRRAVGLLPAEPAWWADTVGEHFPTGQVPYLEALGFGPETGGWAVARLSSGERQRLGLARLLAGAPRVLLLDEPTANLDPESTRRVEDLVLGLARPGGPAVLWVTHDPAQAGRLGGRRAHMAAGVLEPR